MVIPSGMANVMDPGIIGMAATAFRVFPFFERNGEVQALLIVRHDAPEMYAVQHPADWVQYSHPWAVKRALSPSTELTPLQKGDALDRLARLWHYDPWWVLRATPFARHGAVPALQATKVKISLAS